MAGFLRQGGFGYERCFGKVEHSSSQLNLSLPFSDGKDSARHPRSLEGLGFQGVKKEHQTECGKHSQLGKTDDIKPISYTSKG